MVTLAAESEAALRELGSLLSVARARRGITVLGLARRLGVDRRTLAQLEKGKPTVSIGVFVQVLGALNLLRGLEQVVRPENDLDAVSTEIRRLRRRERSSRSIPDSRVDF
ncbi:MAG: helix-turn-helix domain-containing protein [Elusimicrobia bacterium]|nr:helix-turn-helix domain-containing protein [Elusimicrobiota bacterium]